MHDDPTWAEIEAIHADRIARYGGSPGLRDPGQLDAARHRPQTGYDADVIAEAAALWESLSQNHPFVDGNKRTALAATYTFLAINGVRMTANADELWAFLDGHDTGGPSASKPWTPGCGPTRRGRHDVSGAGRPSRPNSAPGRRPFWGGAREARPRRDRADGVNHQGLGGARLICKRRF